MTFPKDFIWGAATSAYQIEGAVQEGGRGPSIWDMFCRRPGAVYEGHTGDVACDHFHRWQEDVALMKMLGLQAYRFSIAWSRILPRGVGAVNQSGLDFYDRLTDELLNADVRPYVTLYHCDYPLALQERGGWLLPDSSEWFADFTAVVVDRLSDRVGDWFTFNEPQIIVGFGFQEGSYAPGERLEFSRVLLIGHNLLLAHGKGVQVIRARARTSPRIGYAVALNSTPVPESEREEDIEVARQVFSSVTERNCMNNTWWSDPVILGRYPEDGLSLFADALPAMGSGDMRTMCQPLDFLGLNVYFGEKYRAGKDGRPEAVPFPPGHPRTSFDWPVVPESIYWASRFYAERYKLPLIVSENGMAGFDTISADQKVHDAQRIEFLQRYLRELRRACEEGIDVRGYFLWSLLDNFEWQAGYSQRFGIVYVDYPTQQRIVKDSGLWYKEVIASHGGTL